MSVICNMYILVHHVTIRCFSDVVSFPRRRLLHTYRVFLLLFRNRRSEENQKTEKKGQMRQMLLVQEAFYSVPGSMVQSQCKTRADQNGGQAGSTDPGEGERHGSGL